MFSFAFFELSFAFLLVNDIKYLPYAFLSVSLIGGPICNDVASVLSKQNFFC